MSPAPAAAARNIKIAAGSKVLLNPKKELSLSKIKQKRRDNVDFDQLRIDLKQLQSNITELGESL